MTWVRISDDMTGHPKFRAVGKDAFMLCLAALVDSAAQLLSDGGLFVPEARIGAIAARAWIDDPDPVIACLLKTYRPETEPLWRRARAGYVILPAPFWKYCPGNFTQPARAAWNRAQPSMPPLVLERSEYRCAYCGSHDDLTVDHIVPIARGGADTLDNLAAACRRCNSSKGKKLLSEWSGPGERDALRVV